MARVKGTDYPDIDIEDVFYKLYKDSGVKPNSKIVRATMRTFRAISTEKLEVFGHVEELLDALTEKNKNLFLVANGQRSFIMSELKLLGLKKYFEKIYISSDMGMRKPEPKVLDIIQNDYKLKKKDTIVIGNDYDEDMRLASKVGFDCLYINTEQSNRKAKEVSSKYKIMDGGDHSQILEILD